MADYKYFVTLSNYFEQYYPIFKNRESFFDSELLECLMIIKNDLKRLILFISDMLDSTIKEDLICYLKQVQESFFLDIMDFMSNNLDVPEDSLSVIVSDNYVMFSVYVKDYLTNDIDFFGPLKVVMSRSLKDMEFYFIEKVEEDYPKYIDAQYVKYFKLLKDKIISTDFYVYDYEFIVYELEENLENSISKLRKYIRF